jgi:MinD superfamily P-loop ATPase
MKEIVVLSGKGGTGKTSIVASFAALTKNAVFVDCDVDAADLHLLLKPVVKQSYEFWSGQVAYIDAARCNQCGLCQELCRFKAIIDFKVDHTACEGCGFCYRICPCEAITMKENLAGEWFISDTKYGPMVHARLGIAQENSGKLVAIVRQKAKEVAKERGLDFIISDGPPGIGCPVISSVSGANLALLVTEPTLSGIHDLERVLGVCRHFGVPALVCINKYDVNLENAQQIERYCQTEGADVIAKIPFDNAFTEAMVRGVPIVEFSNGIVRQQIKILWQNVVDALKHETGECYANI